MSISKAQRIHAGSSWSKPWARFPSHAHRSSKSCHVRDGLGSFDLKAIRTAHRERSGPGSCTGGPPSSSASA
jgi:hypothetical protein